MEYRKISQRELSKKKSIDISNAEKISSLSIQELNPKKKPNGYWTEEIIIAELKPVIEDLGYFPTQTDFNIIHRDDLYVAILRNGGFIYFRRLLGYKLLRKPPGYWNEESIITELESLIGNLGHFPIDTELKEMNRYDLSKAILRHGGSNHFRFLMKHKIIMKSAGYWTEKNILYELKSIIEEIDYFPTTVDLKKMDRKDLVNAISKHGSINYFREKLGFSLSLHEEYLSELMSYIGKRGKQSEQVIEEIIIDWSKLHGKPSPEFNVKLAKGNIIEFVCESNSRIGIDVTNTKASRSSAINTVNNKWKHKNYHLYLDELWIVVFTDVLSLDDYNKLNIKSPDNVKVFSVNGFLREFDYSTEYCNLDKIDKLKNCSFHNKEEIMGLVDQ